MNIPDCPFCCEGKIRNKTIDYESTLKDGTKILVRDLTVEECDSCKEELFSPEACEVIEAEIIKVRPDYFKKTKKP